MQKFFIEILQMKYKRNKRVFLENWFRGGFGWESAAASHPFPPAPHPSMLSPRFLPPFASVRLPTQAIPPEPLNLSLPKLQAMFGMGGGESTALPAPPPPPPQPAPASNGIGIPPISEKNLIHELLDVEHVANFLDLKALQIHPEDSDPGQKLAAVGDDIVEKLVLWAEKLPFAKEIPKSLFSQLLSNRWAELVMLATIFFASQNLAEKNFKQIRQENQEIRMETAAESPTSSAEPDQSGQAATFSTSASASSTGNSSLELSCTDFRNNSELLRNRLSQIMRRQVPSIHVEREAGQLVEEFTILLGLFHRLRVSTEEYVCLKVITLLGQGNQFKTKLKSN